MCKKTLNLKILLIFSTIILSFFSMTAAHAEGVGGKVGIGFGYIVPDADDTKPRELMGFTGSAALTPSFSFGGYYMISDHQTGPGGRDFVMSIHGLSAHYNIPSGQGDTYFGVKAGISKIETDQAGQELLFSPYHFGISAGYDYQLFSRMIVGYEGAFMQFRKSYTDEAGVEYVEQAFNTIIFMVHLKFNL